MFVSVGSIEKYFRFVKSFYLGRQTSFIDRFRRV